MDAGEVDASMARIMPALAMLRDRFKAADRSVATKTDVRIIDFVDTAQPALLRMWEKRRRGYRAMGYRIAEPPALGRV
jgi:hypothetical protein